MENYIFTFGCYTTCDGLRLRTRFYDNWLDSANAIRSDRAGLVVPFNSTIHSINLSFWPVLLTLPNWNTRTNRTTRLPRIYGGTKPEESCGYRLHAKDSILHEVTLPHALNTNVFEVDLAVKEGIELSCFFKGMGFNPVVELLLQKN